jgi:RNA polymerase sigma-70 factor (ECF subfamily)
MDKSRTFMQMVEQHDRELRALAYRLLGGRTAMDDVLQEAYLRAFRGFGSFRGEAAVGTWLYRIVYNACLDHLRGEQRSREMPLEDDGLSGAAAPGGDPAETLPGKQSLAAALASLPVEQRATVLLVDAVGFSYAEAAEVSGVSPGTVASRLNHARSALRKTLVEGRGDETVW